MQLSAFVDFLRIAKHHGLLNAAKLCCADRPGHYVELHPRSCPYPVRVRRDYVDREVFRQIFVRYQYRNTVAERPTPRTILDIGAHIGLATAFFAARFPEARIVALEPNEENFKLLQANTRGYRNVTTLNAALWIGDGPVFLESADHTSWAYQVKASGSGKCVEGISLQTLMRRVGFDHVDLLKMDIEGAEKAVFEHDGDILRNVRTLYIELHDHLVPGSARAVYAACSRSPFRKFQNGEVDILVFD